MSDFSTNGTAVKNAGLIRNGSAADATPTDEPQAAAGDFAAEAVEAPAEPGADDDDVRDAAAETADRSNEPGCLPPFNVGRAGMRFDASNEHANRQTALPAELDSLKDRRTFVVQDRAAAHAEHNRLTAVRQQRVSALEELRKQLRKIAWTWLALLKVSGYLGAFAIALAIDVVNVARFLEMTGLRSWQGTTSLLVSFFVVVATFALHSQLSKLRDHTTLKFAIHTVLLVFVIAGIAIVIGLGGSKPARVSSNPFADVSTAGAAVSPALLIAAMVLASTAGAVLCADGAENILDAHGPDKANEKELLDKVAGLEKELDALETDRKNAKQTFKTSQSELDTLDARIQKVAGELAQLLAQKTEFSADCASVGQKWGHLLNQVVN